MICEITTHTQNPKNSLSYQASLIYNLEEFPGVITPGLKKNILSISALDAKGMRVAFVDGQVHMWPRGKTIDDAIVIGEQEGGLYKLKGHPEQDLFHEIVEPNEI